jgi:hypothetical protein
MDILELNGEWTTQIELPVFAKLRNLKFLGYDLYKTLLANLEKGLITINFWDEHNEEPDPSKEQVSTLNFIINNQQEILQSIFEGFKSEIYPKYQKHIDIDDYSFPHLNSIDDLDVVLAINSITITTHYKDNFAYYELYFSFSGDTEHGIVITMHNLRIIGFGGRGDNDGRAVMTDMGVNYDEWLKEYLDNNDKRRQSLNYTCHKPSAKYGKLKPWQKEENWTYLLGLIRASDIEKLNSLFNNKEIDLEEKYALDKTILSSAVSMKNVQVVQFLLFKGAKVGNAILECNQGDRLLKTEILELLVKNGGDIDYLGYWKRTILYYEIENWINTYQNILIEKKKDSERLERYRDDFEHHNKNIELLIKLGANPMNCDGQNSTYLTLLKKKWREEYIAETGITAYINKIKSENNLK